MYLFEANSSQPSGYLEFTIMEIRVTSKGGWEKQEVASATGYNLGMLSSEKASWEFPLSASALPNLPAPLFGRKSV